MKDTTKTLTCINVYTRTDYYEKMEMVTKINYVERVQEVSI